MFAVLIVLFEDDSAIDSEETVLLSRNQTLEKLIFLLCCFGIEILFHGFLPIKGNPFQEVS